MKDYKPLPLGIIYILIVISISFLFLVPEQLKGILALLGIIIIPNQIGEIILPLLRSFMEELNTKMHPISKYIFSWLVGTYFLFILLLVLYHFAFLNKTVLTTFLILSLAIRLYLFYKYRLEPTPFTNSFFNFFNKHVFILILIILIPILIIKYFQPYPLHYSSFTLFNYLFETLRFTEGNFFSLVPGIHIPLIPMLIGIVSIIFNTDPISLFWAGNMLTYPLFAFGVYIFIKQVSGNYKIALLSSFFAVWMFPNIDFKPIYVFSMRTILAIIYPYILFLIHKEFLSKNILKKEHLRTMILSLSFYLLIFTFFVIFLVLLNMKGLFVLLLTLLPIILLYRYVIDKTLRLFFFILALVVLFFSLTHIWVALICLPVLFFYIFTHFMTKNYQKSLFFVYLFTILTFLLIFFQRAGILKLRDGLFSRILYKDVIELSAFNFQDKFLQLLIYGQELIIFLLIIGIFALYVKRGSDKISISVTSVFLLFLYFFPEPQFFRLMVFSIPFFVYPISFVVFGIKDKILNHYLKSFIIFLIILIVFLSFLTLQYSYINNKLNNDKKFSIDFDMNEYVVSEWIKDYALKIWSEKDKEYLTKTISDPRYRRGENREVQVPLSRDTLIVSDPTTMWILQGLTGRDQVIFQRAFIGLKEYSPESIQQMQEIRKKIFFANSSKNAYEEIKKIKEDHHPVLLIIMPRTGIWGSTDEIDKQFFYQSPKRIPNLNEFDIFKDKTYFTLLFSKDGEFYVFGVNPKPGSPLILYENE